MQLSTPQRKKIYAIARQLNWPNDILHFFLKNEIGKEHISDLTRYEAHKFINNLMELTSSLIVARQISQAFKIRGMIQSCTPAQCIRIRVLMNDADWTEGKLKDYLEQFGAQRLEDLTYTLANELIDYLNSEIRANRAYKV